MRWHGSATDVDVLNPGPLALIRPLLERLGVEDAIDRHLPPDPQREISHGRVLALLLAARLQQPTALVNVAGWAVSSGADILWDVPAAKINDDRLGRALDAFFTARHSIAAEITANALKWGELSLSQLHFDTTHLVFFGRYDGSGPRPDFSPLGNDALAPAHISHGYLTGYRMLQVGVTAAVDGFGALPIACHVLDGNRNGFTAIREQFALLREHLPPPPAALVISDRGTFSAEHVATLARHGQSVVCSVPWHDYRALFDEWETRLDWREAGFLSQEQIRRRETDSPLPLEHYDLAVVRHELTDPVTRKAIPCRVIFVHSTASETEERERREAKTAAIKEGFERLAAKLLRGHPSSTPDSIRKQAVRLLGKSSAAAFFQWEVRPLTAAEQAALPRPGKGFKLATHRLAWAFDAAEASSSARYDGVYALLTTAPRTRNADGLFTAFKQQCYMERLHREAKTPLAVCPVFLKTPQRVEALVSLLYLALLARQAMERVYRKALPMDAPPKEARTTAEQLLRRFRVCGVTVEREPFGEVVRATRLTDEQREVFRRLGLPTLAQQLRRTLRPCPTG